MRFKKGEVIEFDANREWSDILTIIDVNKGNGFYVVQCTELLDEPPFVKYTGKQFSYKIYILDRDWEISEWFKREKLLRSVLK